MIEDGSWRPFALDAAARGRDDQLVPQHRLRLQRGVTGLQREHDHREVEFPRGHAGNPMTDAEVEAKFRRVAEPKYGKAKADAILARCWDLEKLTSVTDLIALFSL